MTKQTINIPQLDENLRWAVTDLNGYEPITDYWQKNINFVNFTTVAIKQAEIVHMDWMEQMESYSEDKRRAIMGMLVSQLVESIEKEYIASEAKGLYTLETPEQWAEFVMSINHLLWIIAESEEYKEHNTLKEVLRELYYKYHEKATETLKGKELHRYLEITD